jgi:hypothetical protein
MIKLLTASFVAGSCCGGVQGNVTCCLHLQGSNNLGRAFHVKVTNTKEEQKYVVRLERDKRRSVPI